MKDFITYAKQKLTVDKKLLVVYVIIYLSCGFCMNEFGKAVEIAKFSHWWQVLTVYGLYMIPISLLLRKFPFHMQYAYGLIAMSLLEFSGYALESSYAYPNNMLDQAFNIRNFSLGMALFFALYFPAGNWLCEKVYQLIFKKDMQ